MGQHSLTKNRQAWTCHECGRYQIFSFDKIEDIIEPSSGATQDEYEGHSLMRYPERD